MSLSYEQFMYIFYGGIVAGCIFLILTVLLFFVFNITGVVGYFSGSTARKAIDELKSSDTFGSLGSSKSNNSKHKKQKSSLTEQFNKGKNTERMAAVAKTAGFTNRHQSEPYESQPTDVLDLVDENKETMLLDNSEFPPTNILDDDKNDNNVGTIIDENAEYAGQTTVLGDDDVIVEAAISPEECKFFVRTEITLFESNELIY